MRNATLFFRKFEGYDVKKALCNARFLSSIGILTGFMMLSLPLIQYVLADFHLGAISALLSKELFRVGSRLQPFRYR